MTLSAQAYDKLDGKVDNGFVKLEAKVMKAIEAIEVIEVDGGFVNLQTFVEEVIKVNEINGAKISAVDGKIDALQKEQTACYAAIELRGK